MLDPRRLALLVSLETLGTVRAVAAASSLSPSAVSQQLAVLEAESGVELFERHGRGIGLTPAGHSLARRSIGILDQIAGVEEELRDWREGEAGVVRVGAFASAFRAFVIDAARSVEKDHSGLRVGLSELEPDETIPALNRGEIDLAVIGSYGDGSIPRPAEIDESPVASDRLSVILPRGHRLGRGPVRLEQLRDERWLVDGTDLERQVLALCRKSGFEPQVVGRLASHGPLSLAVAAGLGVTVLPNFALDRTPGIVAAPVEPAVERRLFVLVRRSAARRPSVARTREALIAAAARIERPA
jgi:DNA-binding transcriptional LysR family regulator